LGSLARAHTEMGVKVLTGIASAEDAPPAARVAAVTALLDRGWGRAPEVHSGEDGGDITITSDGYSKAATKKSRCCLSTKHWKNRPFRSAYDLLQIDVIGSQAIMT